jgi:hypothetical protein
MFKKTSLAIAFVAVASTTAVQAENLYSATLNGAVRAHLTSIPDYFITDSANVWNYPGSPDHQFIQFGGAAQVFGKGPGGAMQMNIVLMPDGTPHSIENIQTGVHASGASPAAITSFQVGNRTMVRHASLPRGVASSCTLDTSVAGQVSYDCIGDGSAIDPDSNDGAILSMPFVYQDTTPNAYGFECWGTDMTQDIAGVNGCGTINELSYGLARLQSASCPNPVAATLDHDGDVNTPRIPMPAGFPEAFTQGGDPTSSNVIPLLECDDESWRARTFGKIHQTAKAEAFNLVYTYSGNLGESNFAITGAEYTSYNHSQAGIERVSEVINTYGSSYANLPNVADGSCCTQFPAALSTVVTNQAFGGNAGKNVPAMGAFGLAALFGGLIAVAARLRRRVS